ncbi:RNase adapter RapZ [Knoellia subterranea]|uniref:GlmZ(SRNA)-inactivating NTPase n=1 Tax=Knoellia subterranea KCTC 19937 TaxID=1385521 RepID=A0A0A0JT03_9MICO|nr:RNase adapter RapZ [Knoellia subterranea]KGN38781.1 glmZ(sRNA)-inactivating NTPase [Knoellia subterranea KCTC 19937]
MPEGSLPGADWGPSDPSGADFVIVTGMSGAGRTTTANVMEDQGWYVVDNLPPQLLSAMAELGTQARAEGRAIRIAAVVDVRSQHFFTEFESATEHLRSAGWTPQLLFLDATDEALVRRFESVRRPHPLQGDGRLLDGIQREREILRDLRSRAQIVVDTSGLNVHQLSRKVAPLFGAGTGPSLRLALLSFGFKYGVPLDADFVFDMRFLPNPFWVPELRALDGRDPEVSAYVLGQGDAGDFLERVQALMEPVTRGYHSEGRRYATIAIGCTGGKHRSVAMAEALAERLKSDRIETFLVHRDLGRE